MGNAGGAGERPQDLTKDKALPKQAGSDETYFYRGESGAQLAVVPDPSVMQEQARSCP